MRSQKFSNECTLLAGRHHNHWCGDLWSVYASNKLLGCVIFFPWLTYVVNLGVKGGAKPPLHCADCVAGGVMGGGRQPPPIWGVWGGWVAPLYGFQGSTLGKFFLDPILGWVNLPMVFGPWFWTRWFFSPWYWMLRHV